MTPTQKSSIDDLFLVKEHPIKMIVRKFSNLLDKVYKPIINKYVLTLWNMDNDEKFLYVISNLEKNASFQESYFQNSLGSDQ